MPDDWWGFIVGFGVGVVGVVRSKLIGLPRWARPVRKTQDDEDAG